MENEKIDDPVVKFDKDLPETPEKKKLSFENILRRSTTIVF